MQINRQTYTEFFLLYVDNELDAGQRLEVEKFIQVNPDLAPELDLFKQTTLTADMDVVFNNKSVLYRKEDDGKVFPFGWWKLAIAAMVVLAVGAGVWIYSVVPGGGNNNPAVVPSIAKTEKKEKVEASITPKDIRNTVKTAPKDHAAPSVAVTSKGNNEVKPKNIEEVYGEENVVVNNVDDGKNIHPVKPEINTAKISNNVDDITNLVNAPAPIDEQFAENNLNAQKPVFKNIPQEDNMIYFANTSFPRKNKFREVFRKASRVIEKVTTLGSDNEISTQ